MHVRLLLVLTFFITSCASNRATSRATTRHVVEVDGVEREFRLLTPADASALSGRRPLVIVLHGGGGNARGIARETGARFRELADADGFYVVFPDAIDGTWDFGAGKVSEELDQRVDDRGYFAALLDKMVADYPIDERRVFATGISRGGQASYFLACNFSERVRAIAPITMSLPRFMLEMCEEGPPVGVAILNGTEDPLVPYDGGQIKVFRQERGEVLSTDATVEFWRSRNGCEGEPRTIVLDPVKDDGMQVVKSAWNDCSGAPVVLYRIEGGGHTWPSGSQYLPKGLIGPVNRDIDGATEAWRFFSSFQ